MSEDSLHDNITETEEHGFIKSELTHFSDFGTVLEVILLLCESSCTWERDWNTHWEPLVMMISKYQEQPSLLNPHLESLVTPLCTQILSLMETFKAFDTDWDITSYKVGGIFFCLLSVVTEFNM